MGKHFKKQVCLSGYRAEMKYSLMGFIFNGITQLFKALFGFNFLLSS